MQKCSFAIAFIASVVALNATAQLVITTGQDATTLAVGHFQGEGVTISNATLNGSSTDTVPATGIYTSTWVDFIPTTGIILSTGRAIHIADQAIGFMSDDSSMPLSDPDLASIVGDTIFDANVLEFDFVPDSELVVFEYAFGSEEYLDFICEYNDGFGLFLSGPGITGPYLNNAINIALLPDQLTPVTINNVHEGYGNCPAMNAEYYYNNMGGAYVVFNGLTTILQAVATVSPGEMHHIKIVIGDALDYYYDSGIFLKAQSFRSTTDIALGVAAASTGQLAPFFNAQGDLVVRGNGPLTNTHLYDAQGRMVHQTGPATLPTTLSTAELPDGIYFLSTFSGGDRICLKVLKQ